MSVNEILKLHTAVELTSFILNTVFCEIEMMIGINKTV